MKSKKISEIVDIALSFVEYIVVWIIYICMYLAVDQTILAIYVHRRRNQGARGATPPPPDFKLYVFSPPKISNQKITNIEWKSLLSMHVLQFLKYITFIRFFARGLCIQCNTLIESTFYVFATSVCLC